MPGLRSIFSLLFLPIIAVTLQNVAFSAPASLITASVKLRVDGNNGHDWGTGTIIDTREGEALVLTCAHIFKASNGNGNVEVHLFGENSTVRVPGLCLFQDAEIDLAFVAVTLPCPVRAIPIAPASYQIQPTQQVWSVGCDHGGLPTVQAHQVMSVDKVSEQRRSGVPFHFIQVSGAPVGGRSGGGLFSADGYLIGVCVTGDPVVNDGHFVPPHIIRQVLDRMDLACVYQNPSLGASPNPPALATLTPLEPIVPMVNSPQPMAMASVPQPMYAENRTELNREEQATLEEIKRRQQDGDEVILIVRSRRDPKIRSDVIFLNGTSDRFLDALVKSAPVQPSTDPGYSSVILSSHDAVPTTNQPVQPAGRQPVSFPVRY
ncbi:MAG: serine protease [Planctomycetaceae bacterium]|jgi:hypothetical protein|nr:serine protease [Planctomycetaceae bacterium]